MKLTPFSLILTILVAILTFSILGCGDNTQPLSLLLQESTKPTSEIADEVVSCYKGVATDTVNKEYAFVFDQDCLDNVLLAEHYTDTAIAEMVSRDDFRLEGKTIKLTGTVWHHLQDSGSLVLNPKQDPYVDIWISPPWISTEKGFDAEKTAHYTVGEIYTFDVLVQNINRERGLSGDTEYTVWCRLITPEP